MYDLKLLIHSFLSGSSMNVYLMDLVLVIVVAIAIAIGSLYQQLFGTFPC
jgi:hypothetical protein